MEDDASQEEKQNYLRENILEKGYDANAFVAFLKSKKGEAGSDISNWSMEDLCEVVQEFISINSPPEKEKEKEKEPEPEPEPVLPPKKETVNLNRSRFNSVKLSRTQSYIPNLTDEDYGLITPEFLKCQKSETTELVKYDNIEISVKDPKKVSGGFFSKDFILYLVTTNPLKISVKRKHDDFIWLRERLSIIYNLNVLPRLPKKGKVNEDKHINKRLRNLEKFLNYLIKDPLIKSSNILYDFLTLDKDKDFEKRKKIYNKMKTPIELKDIKTIDGRIKINVNPNKEIFLDNIKANSAFNETCLKKFNENFKLLKEEMNKVIGRVYSFGPLFDKLIKISSIYLDSNAIIESYKQMKNIFNSCAEMIKRQSGFFYNDVKEYLKLLNGNYHHMRDIVQLVETHKINYNKAAKTLIAKKEELFKKGDTNSWQLDVKDRNNLQDFYFDRIASYKKICAKDTRNLIKVKEKYGYHLNKIISEFQRIRNINTVEHKNKVIQFATKESEIISDYSKILNEIIEVMKNIKENTNKEDNNMEKKVKSSIDLSNIDKEENKNEIIENNKNTIKEKENKNEIKEKNNKKIKEEDKNEINDKKEEKKEEDNINEIKDENKNEIKDKKEEIREENINGRNESKDNIIVIEDKNKKDIKEENKDEIKEKGQDNINKEDIKNEIDEIKNKDIKVDKNEDNKKEEEGKKDEEKKEGEKKEEDKKDDEKKEEENKEENKKDDEKKEEENKEEDKKDDEKKEEENKEEDKKDDEIKEEVKKEEEKKDDAKKEEGKKEEKKEEEKVEDGKQDKNEEEKEIHDEKKEDIEN